MTSMETMLSVNRTGIQMSPLLAGAMLKSKEFENRETYVDEIPEIERSLLEEAGLVGSVPVPATLKGVAAAGIDMLKGEKPARFINKMGERLVFERTGVRLYEALLRKAEVKGAPRGLSIGRIRQIRDEELQHMFIVKKAMENMGADPTAVTPSADVVSVISQGFLQVLTDPRTTIAQCLDACLMLELADDVSWVMLIEMAKEFGHDESARAFDMAEKHEAKHVLDIREAIRMEQKNT